MSSKVGAARRRRGFPRGIITKASNTIKDLERRATDPDVPRIANRALRNIENADVDFKKLHLATIELLESEEDLAKEQDVLDEHEAVVDDLIARINRLIVTDRGATTPDPRHVATKRLERIEAKLAVITDNITKLSSKPDDKCVLCQWEEQLREVKQELCEVAKSPVMLDLDPKNDLLTRQDQLEARAFDNSLALKRALSEIAKLESSRPSSTLSIKLPKIDIPTFNGDMITWRTFWEQFDVSVHSRSDISKPEKLVYLRQSLRSGSAKNVIEGLSKTSDDYDEAIECLTKRYDRPRLIHQAHVKTILDIPPLKTGSGKELRHLHDVAQQHLRALKTMECEPSGPFVTSVLELKLDSRTMFEWQRHTSTSTGIPPYSELLSFINLRAQAAEHSTSTVNKTNPGEERKNHKILPAHPANIKVEDTGICVACKNATTHPLYSCTKFRSLSRDGKMAIVKENNLCHNCLRPGHFVRQCKSLHKCHECQRPHHSLLHFAVKDGPVQRKEEPDQKSNSTPATSLAASVKPNALLMTCQVLVTANNGLSAKARALLDAGSSASFISEWLAKSLHLRRQKQSITVTGIGGLTHPGASHDTTSFRVSSLIGSSEDFNVSAVVIPRVTCHLPTSSTPPQSNWSHIEGLQLADPTFCQPGAVDLLLGVDVFVSSLLHGRRSGALDSPTALETKFGWVLAGDTHGNVSLPVQHVSHHTTALAGDDMLRKFWELEESPSEPVFSVEEKAVVEHFKENHFRLPDGRFVVPLPKRDDVSKIGESRSQAVRRFLSLERSLHSKEQFSAFADVIEEYFSLCHAEEVPLVDLQKPPCDVFYLPMYAVHKQASTTTKLRVVFDASAKSSSGISLNDTLMVGPTLH